MPLSNVSGDYYAPLIKILFDTTLFGINCLAAPESYLCRTASYLSFCGWNRILRL